MRRLLDSNPAESPFRIWPVTMGTAGIIGRIGRSAALLIF